jgi:hypothetical protein
MWEWQLDYKIFFIWGRVRGGNVYIKKHTCKHSDSITLFNSLLPTTWMSHQATYNSTIGTL